MPPGWLQRPATQPSYRDHEESEWRAWLLASVASQRLNDNDKAREQLAQAKAVLLQLQQKWGAEAFQKYLTRPDIQVYYNQLG